MKKRILAILIPIVIISLFFVWCVAGIVHTRYVGRVRSLESEITTIEEAYEFANNYINGLVDTEKYELYEVRADYDKDLKGEWSFAYTKRVGLFKDVYFVCLDTNMKTVKLTRQGEAERGYGRDHIVDITKWKFKLEDVWCLGEGIDYDTVRWNSLYEDNIQIYFVKDGQWIKNISVNAYTGEII